MYINIEERCRVVLELEAALKYLQVRLKKKCTQAFFSDDGCPRNAKVLTLLTRVKLDGHPLKVSPKLGSALG